MSFQFNFFLNLKVLKCFFFCSSSYLCTYEDCAKAFRSYAELNCHVKLRHLGMKKNVRSNKMSIYSEQNTITTTTTDDKYIVMYQEDSTPSDDIKSDLNSYIKDESNLAEFNTETGEMHHSSENSMSATTTTTESMIPSLNSNIISEIDPTLIDASSDAQLNDMQTDSENQLGEILEVNEGLDIQNLIQSQHLAYDEDGNIVMSQDYFIVSTFFFFVK